MVESGVQITKTNHVTRARGKCIVVAKNGRWWLIVLISHRQLLLCRVALGKSFLQFSAMKMAHAPPGHHSVIGRPSVGGLHFPEYVVYRGEQVDPIQIEFSEPEQISFKSIKRPPHRPIRNIWSLIKSSNRKTVPATRNHPDDLHFVWSLQTIRETVKLERIIV